MSSFSRSPRTIRGGIVLLDPSTGAVLRIVAFQYNPETLTRTLAPQHASPQEGSRVIGTRYRAPAVETLKVDVELDASDLLEEGDASAAENGIHPQIAALEALVQPLSADLRGADALSSQGALEILAPKAALAVFVFGRARVVPVKVTDMSITEDAFDPNLNPIRARVSLGMQVLTVNDVGFSHRGGGLFLAWLESREALAGLLPPTTFATLGITGVF